MSTRQNIKISNRNKAGSIFKSFGIKDYLRQFSIVVGGIIVTFWGSDLISENARQKEVRATMQLVAEELHYNLESLKGIRALMDKDIRMSSLLIEHSLLPSAIPIDTLDKYKTFFSNLSGFNYRSDALEVLKGSSLMQHIPDKRTLQNILQIYYRLGQKQININNYYSLKSDVLYGITLSKSKEEVIQTLKPDRDLYKYISYQMNQPSFCSYVTSVPGFLDWEDLDELEKDLDKQIRTLEENYQFQINI